MQQLLTQNSNRNMFCTGIMPSLGGGGFTTKQFYGAVPPNILCSIPQLIIQQSHDVTDNKTAEMQAIERKHIYTMNDIFHREDERLKTFAHWPLDWLNKNTLALTGMFYTGEDDKVKCYFCEVEIGRWERTDQPVSEHQHWSPSCPLLRRRTTNNVPLNAEALDRILPAASYDICGANESSEAQRNAYMDESAPGAHMFTTTEGSGCSRRLTYFPEYPEYAVEAARLRSYAEWPRNMKQKSQQIAEAGFFYTGVGDRVKCFSCGGGLKDWDDNDDPWEQHAMWMSNCRFLKLMKGQSYIDSVKAKQKEIEAAELAAAEAEKPQADQQVATTSESSAKPVATQEVSGGCDVAPCAAVAPLAAAATNGPIFTDSMSNKSAVNASIQEEKLCKICYSGEYNTAFLPCGHVVACAKCASSVTKCPLCRKPFTDVMRVYFS